MNSRVVVVAQDPTEHVNLKASEPALFESMRQKLLAEGKTLYQTNYAEPGTGPVKALGIGNPQGGGGSGKCISGPQVSPGHHHGVCQGSGGLRRGVARA